MPPDMAKKTQTPPKSFEDALRELEEILAEIETGEMGLEESLHKYERGNFLIHHCRGVLAGAEKQIELLSRSADGSMASTAVPIASVTTDGGEGGPPAPGAGDEDDVDDGDADVDAADDAR